ncbi:MULTISPECIES: hypothetical protein [Legionella]|uniref:Uncharacterized protein n=1 Tax=Legionella drozanskii LLAP-1 TaxID=1212489 RepID=A0A0W0SXD6_9GAMM|nr:MULTISPECIES: hypothetical protein [Legionella]KTC87605.1 hypothetical protein Ldro_1224 [Legionella drozanskii LLAP-1]PJE16578.1 MAG: hypothetical protein CK430_03260 [Legionella sp.]
MALDFDEIKKNQNRLNQHIIDWNSVVARGELFRERQKHFDRQKNQILKLDTLNSASDWFAYENVLIALKLKLESLVRDVQLLDATAKIDLHLYLLVVLPLLNEKSLTDRKSQIELRKTERLAVILRLQQTVDSALMVLAPNRERVFAINLAEFRVDYEKAYVTQHGQGCWGFFALPFKYYYRKSSRSEELRFLEDVNIYLQSGAGATLFPLAKERFKLSALNLVRIKINTEEHGKTSQLKRLIETRLEDAGLSGNKNTEIIKNFIDLCQSCNINVPECLVTNFENNYRPIPSM